MKSIFKKKLFYCLICILAILSAFYFILTSNIFLANVFVPAIAKYIIKTDYTIKEIRYNPFTSYLEMDNIVVGDIKNPFITAKKAGGYITLSSIFNKTIKLDDIKINNVDINFNKNNKANWSIPWLYVNVPKKDIIQFAVDLTDINITNMNIKYKQDIKYGKQPLEAEMKGLTITSKQIKNGVSSTIKYNGKIEITSSVTGIKSEGNITGITQVKLAKWCIPSHVNISSIIKNITTDHKYPKIPNRKITFDLDIKRDFTNSLNNNINYLRIKDIINNKLDSELYSYGHLNFYPFNFKININAEPIKAPVLRIFNNLLGNYDLGNANLSYLGNLSASHKTFKSEAKLSILQALPTANDYQVSYGTPLNFLLNYSFGVDYDNNTAIIERLSAILSKKDEEIINISLNKAMPLSYKKDQNMISKIRPTINILTSSLDLDNINPLLNSDMRVLSGILDSDITLSLDSNNSLLIKGTTKTSAGQLEITNMNKLFKFNVDQLIDIRVRNFNNIIINNYELKIFQRLDKASKIKIKGNYNIHTKKGRFHTVIPHINQNFLTFYQCMPGRDKKIFALLEKSSPFNIFLENDLTIDLNKEILCNVENLKLIFSNPEKNSSLTLTLLDHFSFYSTPHKLTLNRDIILKSDVKNLDFVTLLDFFPKSFPLKFSKGNFTYDLLLIIPKEMNSLKIKGQLALLYSSLNLYNQHIRDMSITNNINAVIYDTKAINFIDSSSELYINGIQCLKAKTNGVLTFNNTDDSSLIISIEDINKYFSDIFYNGISVNIDSLKARGKIYCRLTDSGNNSFFKGEINMSEAIFGDTTVSGGLKFDVVSTKNDFKIKSLNVSLLDKSKEIVQLDILGNFPIPLKSKKSILNINSEKILLDELTPIYKNLNRAINKTFVEKNGEYDPIDFKGLNLDGDIKFNSITYGKLLKSDFYSKLNIKNNKITINQAKSTINNTDITYHIELDTNHIHGYPFKFNTEYKNLDMEPFIRTFIPGDYLTAGGTVNSFSLALQGKGFSKENIKKELKGNLNIILSKLSLPYQINKYNVLKFLLAPLVILEKIREMLPGGFLVKNFEKGIQSTTNIFNNLNNINLKSGIIMLTANEGKVEINKVEFLGEPNEPVNYSDFYGSIDFDGNLDIYAKSDITNIILPFYIDGMISNPTPDFAFFIPKFLFLNILTILNPINILGFTADIFIGVYRTFEGIAVATWDMITSPFRSDPPKKTETAKTDAKHKINDTTPREKKKIVVPK